jgi:hypothetical protein
MIGMQTADIVSVRVLCIPGHDVIQALLRTRKVGHPFVLALRTKLIKQLDEVGDEKA